ncbi:hypothetical protein PoB_007196900 [Plakobranchus ocellatus]|uniref:Uncharacterized protein n=1 Tax=Plakobranchus ocellatus TaxID=259542 RepID=A0AAV4DNC5_9GAST|nr:hypothetical protein PoB_007196900 [Plakobranchus ocellatus]
MVKQMKPVPVEKQVGLQALWQDLRMRHSALSKVKSTRGSTPSNNVAMYCSKAKLRLTMNSIVEEHKRGKARLGLLP